MNFLVFVQCRNKFFLLTHWQKLTSHSHVVRMFDAGMRGFRMFQEVPAFFSAFHNKANFKNSFEISWLNLVSEI